MSRRDEYADAMGDIVAFNILAMQLLVLTLERRGVIELGDYAEALTDYLNSEAATMFDHAGVNALLGDLLSSVSRDDG